jgi:hypothetical protein
MSECEFNPRPRANWWDGRVLCGAILQRVLSPIAEAKEFNDGQRQNPKVQTERPVLDVVVVKLDTIGDRGLSAQPVHLSPTGDAGLDAVALGVARHHLGEQLDELGALRSGSD